MYVGLNRKSMAMAGSAVDVELVVCGKPSAGKLERRKLLVGRLNGRKAG